MGLKPYSDVPARAAVQVLSDVAVLTWVVLWVWVGRAVHDAIATMAAVGTSLEGGASGLSDRLSAAGRQAARLPFVGDDVAKPLRDAGGAAADVANAGRDFTVKVDSLADLLGVLTAITPIVLVVGMWLSLRYTFARRAAATAKAARSPAGENLLALRALTTRPLRLLAAVHPDPVAAWRDGDPAVVSRLAALEAARSGVRLPPKPR